MKEIKLWWIRTFRVISTKEAMWLSLTPHRNIYGDNINRLGCRSIWKDRNGRTYRVKELAKFSIFEL